MQGSNNHHYSNSHRNRDERQNSSNSSRGATLDAISYRDQSSNREIQHQLDQPSTKRPRVDSEIAEHDRSSKEDYERMKAESMERIRALDEFRKNQFQEEMKRMEDAAKNMAAAQVRWGRKEVKDFEKMKREEENEKKEFEKERRERAQQIRDIIRENEENHEKKKIEALDNIHNEEIETMKTVAINRRKENEERDQELNKKKREAIEDLHKRELEGIERKKTALEMAEKKEKEVIELRMKLAEYEAAPLREKIKEEENKKKLEAETVLPSPDDIITEPSRPSTSQNPTGQAESRKRVNVTAPKANVSVVQAVGQIEPPATPRRRSGRLPKKAAIFSPTHKKRSDGCD